MGAEVHVADLCRSPPDELQGQEKFFFTSGCDVSKRAACRDFLDSIPGRLDGVVNCAGVAPFEGTTPSDEVYRLNMDVNVTGTWNVGSEAIARLSRQEDITRPGIVPGTVRAVGQGSIVNIGSGASLRGTSGMAAYTASKHAVLGLTRSWAKDHPRMRVNCVAPGLTDTPMAKTAYTANGSDAAAEVGKTLLKGIPMGRLAYPTDIADAVVFLLSDWSSFITGQCLPVNGGDQ